jgi:hypothetical protein
LLCLGLQIALGFLRLGGSRHCEQSDESPTHFHHARHRIYLPFELRAYLQAIRCQAEILAILAPSLLPSS